MERKSWIWGKMRDGKIQLFDSMPSLKAAAPGKRNHGRNRHSGRGCRCWLRAGKTLLLLAVPCHAGGHGAAGGDQSSQC